ncbi:MAG: hypothetical protein RL630_2203, partial [Verrucomicrobiota bacterium]
MKFAQKIPLFSISAWVICSLLTSGCTQYASVSERRPTFPASLASDGGGLAKRLKAAIHKRKSQPTKSLSSLLLEARAASRELATNPSNSTARDTYNFAVARIVETLQQAQLAPWEAPLRIASADGELILTAKKDPRPGWNPALYKFVPADQFDVHGKYVRERSIKPGIGAPIVA